MYLPVDVTEVRLEGNLVIIEFTTAARPGCRFGYRSEAIPTGSLGQEIMQNEDPDMYASMLRVNLEEQIEAVGYGLPKDCVPGELTWVG